MYALLQIAEHTILDRFIRENTPIAAYDKVGTGFMILSGLLSVLGLGLLVYASHIYFMKNFATEIAFALTGSVTLGLAVVFALGVLLHKTYKMKKLQAIKSNMMDAIWDTIESLEEDITEPVQEYPKSAVAIATIAGFAAAEHLLDGTKRTA